MSEVSETNMVDCDHGRCQGCKTFCCMLIVRLTEEEAEALYPGESNRMSLDKNLVNGYCEFLDMETHQCSIFDKRPLICRSYTCNDDEMLQTALKTEFTSIVDLAVKTQKIFIPKETWVDIPKLDA